MTTGWEEVNSDSLLIVRENLWRGLGEIGNHFIQGTAHVAQKEGLVSPAQAGASLTLPLFLAINTELVSRGEEDFTGRLS